jgi:hypothetical protein
MSFGKRRKLAGATLVLLAMILALAGCGSSSGSTESTETAETAETTETTSSLTKAAFVKKGNAICAKSEEEVAAGVEKLAKENNALEKKPLSAKQMEAVAGEVLVPTVRKQLNEIRALGIPSGDEQEVEAIFAAVEEGIEKTEEDPSAFAEGGSGPFVKANKLAREYGLTVCGSEPENEEGKSAGE